MTNADVQLGIRQMRTKEGNKTSLSSFFFAARCTKICNRVGKVYGSKRLAFCIILRWMNPAMREAFDRDSPSPSLSATRRTIAVSLNSPHDTEEIG